MEAGGANRDREETTSPIRADRRFAVPLLAIAVAGFGTRLLYAELGRRSGGFPSDDAWYHVMAGSIADGHGLSVPRETLTRLGLTVGHSGRVPTAFHPPLFPALLAIGSKLGLTSYGAHRAIGCAFGAATVGLVGVVGRRLGGARLGLLAAGIAAVYLPLVANESVLMSESLFGLTIAASIVAAYRFGDGPSWRRAAALGVAVGLAALTRAEGLLLLVLLVPFAVRRPGVSPLRHFLVAAAATAVVVAPWCVRNSIAFHRPVGISTGDGAVLAGANNHDTYYGGQAGTWDIRGTAVAPPAHPERFNEAVSSERLRRRGLVYARDHAARAPLVAFLRVLRTWSVYPLDPAAKVRYTAFIAKRREAVEWPTLFSGWAVMLLALAGVLRLRRQDVPLAPLVAPLALVTVVSALFFGDVRFREAADVSLVALAAVGLTSLVPSSTGAWLSGGSRDRAASPRLGRECAIG